MSVLLIVPEFFAASSCAAEHRTAAVPARVGPQARIAIAELIVPAVASEEPAESELSRQKILQFFRDVWLTIKIKSVLLMSGKAKRADLNVNTSGGVVAVVGFVESEEQKESIVELIQGVDGVEAVRALLVVKSEPGRGT